MSLVLGEFSKPDPTSKDVVSLSTTSSTVSLSLPKAQSVDQSVSLSFSSTTSESEAVTFTTKVNITLSAPVRRTALVLFKVFRQLCALQSEEVQRTMRRWIVMCLPNFVQLSHMNATTTTTTTSTSNLFTRHYWQALWSLTIVLISTSSNPLLYSLYPHSCNSIL
jgi:hypothetical protein